MIGNCKFSFILLNCLIVNEFLKLLLGSRNLTNGKGELWTINFVFTIRKIIFSS